MPLRSFMLRIRSDSTLRIRLSLKQNLLSLCNQSESGGNVWELALKAFCIEISSCCIPVWGFAFCGKDQAGLWFICPCYAESCVFHHWDAEASGLRSFPPLSEDVWEDCPSCRLRTSVCGAPQDVPTWSAWCWPSACLGFFLPTWRPHCRCRFQASRKIWILTGCLASQDSNF